jgi:hypothetical protein
MLLVVVVVAAVVILATSIITPIISTFVIVAVVTAIPIVVALIGPAVTVITSIRSTVTVVEMLVTVLVVIIIALTICGVGGYSKGMLQLLALPHGMFGVVVELALVVHDHVEVTFEEGGRSWWICHVSFARLLSQPISSIVMIFSIEVMHYRVLSVNYLVNIGHEVGMV